MFGIRLKNAVALTAGELLVKNRVSKTRVWSKEGMVSLTNANDQSNHTAKSLSLYLAKCFLIQGLELKQSSIVFLEELELESEPQDNHKHFVKLADSLSAGFIAHRKQYPRTADLPSGHLNSLLEARDALAELLPKVAGNLRREVAMSHASLTMRYAEVLTILKSAVELFVIRFDEELSELGNSAKTNAEGS